MRSVAVVAAVLAGVLLAQGCGGGGESCKCLCTCEDGSERRFSGDNADECQASCKDNCPTSAFKVQFSCD